jgi:uncharacterized glyoxalase superfamily protein PhnB
VAHTDPVVTPILYYRDAPAALTWLERAFGFETSLVVTDKQGQVRFSRIGIGGSMVTIESEQPPRHKSPLATNGVNTQGIQFTVDDVDAHCARATSAGAEIVMALQTHGFGREYCAADPEGHVWSFRQADLGTGEMHEGWRVRIPNRERADS